MRHLWASIIALSLIASAAACSGDNPSAHQTMTDAATGDTGPHDTGPHDVSLDTTLSDADAATTDAGNADANDAAASHGRTLADYRRCQTNLDCPVGLGVCVKEVSLNRPDANGDHAVPIGQIFPRLGADEGICTLVCTTNPEACAALSVNGTTADDQPHTCQLVTTGQAPYPAAPPAFPFDDQLDPTAMAEGQPFGAICRPPFGLDDAVSDAFCQSCRGPDSCGDNTSLCFNSMTGSAAQDGEDGLCLTPCGAGDACPMGFVCDADDGNGQSYCRPRLDTCSACRDVDQDGFGTGLCGPSDSPVTGDDCDDRNPDAYYDPDHMDHAFPRTCGEQDFNCNGISDAVEEVGAQHYPEDHCAGCFDTCSGDLPNGQKFCQQGATPDQGVCVAQCPRDADGKLLFADCDGDISNGCEVAADDPSRQYYRDADGDGFGDPNDVQFDCGNTGAPSGYVANDEDCNDTSAAAHGGPNPPAEVCDGLDNDCNGSVDDGPMPTIGDACADSGLVGACKPGHQACENGAVVCAPDVHPGDQAETCATPNVDDDCDGQTNDVANPYLYYPDNDGDGHGAGTALPTCAPTAPAGYAASSDDCDDANADAYPPAVASDHPELCSTPFDDNCNGQINEDGAVGSQTWYDDADGDGHGNPTTATAAPKCAPPATFQHGVTVGDDCNDSDASVVKYTFYRDADGDTYGNRNDTALACTAPSGYVANADDCNDNSSHQAPGLTEVCNGIDDNCNQTNDESCPDGTVLWQGTEYPASAANMGNLSWGASLTEAGGAYDAICPAGTVWSAAKVNYTAGSSPVVWIEPGCQKFHVNPDFANQPNAWTQLNYYLDKASVNGWTYVHNGTATFIGGHNSAMGNTTSTFECPADSAIYKVEIKYGTVVSRVKFYCRSYSVGAGPAYDLTNGYTDTFTGAYGGTGTPNVDSQQCQPGQVAVGMHPISNRVNGIWSIVQMRLFCADVQTEKITAP